MDLNTLIMEPSKSLQEHIFNHIANVTYRDINEYNPLNITHPPDPKEFFYLDQTSRSPIGDGQPDSINLIVPQDCGGFNLGSFFIKRSEWSERLLDIWWDPVGYEQKHMEWEHKEQDSLVWTPPSPNHLIPPHITNPIIRSISTSTNPGSAPAPPSSRNA